MKGVEIGQFWANQGGYVRRITGYDGPSVKYREYATRHGSFVTDGQLLPASLKRWGDLITEDQARQIVSGMDELDARQDRQNVDHHVREREFYLKTASDTQILGEARRRGLIKEQPQ